jgi:hypothetical protein
MRFEPRLLRPDDNEPDDSLELPDDLVELAEQLCADANYLAARFPASGQARPRAESAARFESPGRCDNAGRLEQPAHWRYTGHWENTRPAKTSSHDFGRRLLRGTAAAVLLTGIGLWGGRLWSALGTHPPRGPQAAVAQFSAAARERDMVRDGSAQHVLASDDFVGDGAAGAALPFRSLSGGEQEGVLDLLEEQPFEEAQVSI